MNGDRTWTSAAGPGSVTLPGRALLLCRNVGLHMYTDAVMLGSEEVPEGIVDAMVTAAAAMHDLQGNSRVTNSKTGSVRLVTPRAGRGREAANVLDSPLWLSSRSTSSSPRCTAPRRAPLRRSSSHASRASATRPTLPPPQPRSGTACVTRPLPPPGELGLPLHTLKVAEQQQHTAALDASLEPPEALYRLASWTRSGARRSTCAR